MFSDRIFLTALLISLAAHAAVLSLNPDFHLFRAPAIAKNLEIRYVKAPQEEKAAPKPDASSRKEPLLKLSARISADKKVPPPFMSQESILKEARAPLKPEVAFTKSAFLRPDIIAIKKKITLPPVELDKINNPSYISYYQIVREKIRRSAYQNFSHNETGEVYLSFIISSDGLLKEARIAEEKTSGSQYLKDVALRSIKEASPFPNFPKQLDYPYLSFNVIISFEIE